MNPSAETEKPAVVLLHGFLSNRREVPVNGDNRGMFEYLSDIFYEYGISTVTMDFRGCGKSLGLPLGYCTPTSMIQDIVAVTSAPDMQCYFRNGFILVGWCQGAIAAMHAGILGLSNCLGISLLNPFADFRATLDKVYIGALQKALEMPLDGVIEITMASGRVKKVTTGFFQEMVMLEGLQRLSRVDVPVQIVHATEDRILPEQESFTEFLNGEADEYHRIATDHAFGVFGEEHCLDALAKIVSNFAIKISKASC